MRRKWLFLLVLLAPLGCVTPENIQPPSFDVANLRLGSPGLFSQELKIDLKIGNPNDFDIPLTGLAFKLEVNGEHFAEGLSNESVTLPRLGYANVRVTGNANTLSILRQLSPWGPGKRSNTACMATPMWGVLA
jgi:LEA14-like dessication related protein